MIGLEWLFLNSIILFTYLFIYLFIYLFFVYSRLAYTITVKAN